MECINLDKKIPDVSVIIPVYNVQKYLEQCINSVIKQTYYNIEIILIDDGSTDNSGKICDDYAKKDNRIIVMHIPNGGSVLSRRAGLNISRGKYISFVDADDWIDEILIEDVITKLNETKADYAVFGYYQEQEKTISIPVVNINKTVDVYENIDDLLDSLILFKQKNFYMLRNLWGKIFKRNIIIPAYNRLPERCSWGEDYISTIDALFSSSKITFINKCYYHYRIRKGSYSTTLDLQSMANIAFLHSQLATVLEQHNYYHQVKDKLNYMLMKEINFRCKNFCSNKEYFYRELFYVLRGKKLVFIGNKETDINDISNSLLINEKFTYISIYQDENSINLRPVIEYINNHKNDNNMYMFITPLYNKIVPYLTHQGLRENYDFMNGNFLL